MRISFIKIPPQFLVKTYPEFGPNTSPISVSKKADIQTGVQDIPAAGKRLTPSSMVPQSLPPHPPLRGAFSRMEKGDILKMPGTGSFWLH